METIQRKLRHNTTPKREITCLGWKSAKVNRNKSSKWYVSPRDYPEPKYPMYCSGFFLLFTGASIAPLYERALAEHFFWIDDIWLTGFVARKCQVSINVLKNSIYQNVNVEKRFMSGRRGLESLAGHLDKNIDKMVSIWNFLMKRFYLKDPKLIRVLVNKHGWTEFNLTSKQFLHFKE